MDLELREIRERPLFFLIVIAVIIHVAICYASYLYLKTPGGQNLVGIGKIEDTDITPEDENKPQDTVIDETNPSAVDGNENDQNPPVENVSTPLEIENDIPPFEKSDLTMHSLEESTFVHEESGLLFADEIIVPGEEKQEVLRRNIVKPVINRDFKLNNLPTEFRDRTWNLTLKLKVDGDGYPAGRIRILRSSGNSILDQIILKRVEESTFEPAHYEGSTKGIDYTYEMEINIE